MARVKKIIAMDEDIAQCSNSAAFAISVATVSVVRILYCPKPKTKTESGGFYSIFG